MFLAGNTSCLTELSRRLLQLEEFIAASEQRASERHLQRLRDEDARDAATREAILSALAQCFPTTTQSPSAGGGIISTGSDMRICVERMKEQVLRAFDRRLEQLQSRMNDPPNILDSMAALPPVTSTPPALAQPPPVSAAYVLLVVLTSSLSSVLVF
jgi:hypothetical protein